MWLTETTLEMHYHRPLMEAFRATLGVGKAGQVNFYKYSPQREMFIGFDQAYARSELSPQAFLALLRDIASGHSTLPDKFVGYFLQFKVVSQMTKRSKYTPSTITAKPHYRAELETTRNARTGASQHELLFRLSQSPGALVYYACPMLFDRSDLYDIEVDLDTLALPELTSCPSDYCDNNDPHYIYFNSPTAQPVWCSQPTFGTAVRPVDLVDQVLRVASANSPSELAETLEALLTNPKGFPLQSPDEQLLELRPPASILPLVGGALTVLRFSEYPEEAYSK